MCHYHLKIINILSIKHVVFLIKEGDLLCEYCRSYRIFLLCYLMIGELQQFFLIVKTPQLEERSKTKHLLAVIRNKK